MDGNKPWYASVTLFGNAMVFVALIAGLFGYVVTEADQQATAVTLAGIGAGIGALVSTVGRIRASKRIGPPSDDPAGNGTPAAGGGSNPGNPPTLTLENVADYLKKKQVAHLLLSAMLVGVLLPSAGCANTPPTTQVANLREVFTIAVDGVTIGYDTGLIDADEAWKLYDIAQVVEVALDVAEVAAQAAEASPDDNDAQVAFSAALSKLREEISRLARERAVAERGPPATQPVTSNPTPDGPPTG